MWSEIPDWYKLWVAFINLLESKDCISLTITKDLSAAVDVYSDWVDACDSVAKSKANTLDVPDSQAIYSRGSPLTPRDGPDADLEAPAHDDL